MPPTTTQVFAVLVCVTAVVALSKLKEDDECLASSKGRPPWVCKLPPDCHWGQELIKAGKNPPPSRVCGLSGWNRLLCCPPYKVSEWIESGVPVPPKKGKAAEMCQKYSRVLYVKDIYDPDKETYSCDAVEPTILGGKDAVLKEFPHMALVGFGLPTNYRCGGTLISERFVLSAAHCERHPQYGLAQFVLLGELDTANDTDGATPELFGIEQIYVHPEYNPSSTYHDIMLLKLDRDVTFSLYIRPICIQTERETKWDVSIASGWGIQGEGTPLSTMLQKIDLPYVNSRTCREDYKELVGTAELKDGINDKIQLCAGGKKDQDTCGGDSGGPLQISIPNMGCMFHQIGIVSFGKTSCGTKGVPGVYTRVSAYVPWIEKIVWG